MMRLVPRRRLSPIAQYAVGGGVVLLLLLVPFVASSAIMFRVGVAVTAALLALSFNLLFGTTGLISFGHAAFFAVGGYGIGLALQTGLSWPVALLVAALLGGVVGAVFSIVVLRVSGVHFAILTLALGEIIHIVVLQSEATGGENGLTGISAGTMLGIDLGTPVVYYWVVVVVASLAAVGLKLITDSRFGRTLTAIREDDVRAAYLGIPVRRYRAASFTVSATFAALAGALFAPLVGLMVPADAGWTRSAEPILATLLGGANSFFGPALGAAVFAALDYLARDLAFFRIILTGALLLVVILIAPGGITGTIKSRLNRRRRQSDKPPVEEGSSDKVEGAA